jgi:hypothetical protein
VGLKPHSKRAKLYELSPLGLESKRALAPPSWIRTGCVIYSPIFRQTRFFETRALTPLFSLFQSIPGDNFKMASLKHKQTQMANTFFSDYDFTDAIPS